MRNRLRRFLALVMTAFMFVNMIPVNVFAEQSASQTVGDWIDNQGVSVLAVGEDFEITADTSYVLIDGTLQLSVPAGYEVGWTSTNPTVATVDDSGLVTAHVTGVSHIIATAQDGQSARFTVTVVDGEYQIRYNVTYPSGALNYVYSGTVTTKRPVDTTIIESIDALPGSSYTIRDDIECFTHKVSGWRDAEGNLYRPGDAIEVSGNLDLTPEWESKGYSKGTVDLYYASSNTSDRTKVRLEDIPVFYTRSGDRYTIYVQVHKNEQLDYDTPNRLLGFTTNRGGSTEQVEQGGILTYTTRLLPRSITLYPVFGDAQPENICQFYIVKPSEESSFNESLPGDYYFVGMGTVSDQAVSVLPYQTAYGSNNINADITKATVDGRTYNFLGTAPKMDQILSYLGEQKEGNTTYSVRWYKVSNQDDGWRIDGILIVEGVQHTIKYIDTYNNQIVEQDEADDNTQYDVLTNAPAEDALSGVKEGRRTFKGWYFDAAGTQPVTDENKNLLVNKDYTVYAVYQDLVTVQYRDDEGDLYEGGEYLNAYQTVNKGQNGVAVEWTPSKSAHTFIGWRDSRETEKVLTSEEIKNKLTRMQNDAVFYALFKPNINIDGVKTWAGEVGTADGHVDLAVYVRSGDSLAKLNPQPLITWQGRETSGDSTSYNFFISNLPHLTEGTYVVRELNGSNAIADADTVELDGTIYTVTYDDESYTITNTPPATADLTIVKAIDGDNQPEDDEQFILNWSYGDEDSKVTGSITATWKGTGFTYQDQDGNATNVVSGIPVGATVKVTESGKTASNWTATMTGDGTIKIAEGENSFTVTNTQKLSREGYNLVSPEAYFTSDGYERNGDSDCKYLEKGTRYAKGDMMTVNSDIPVWKGHVFVTWFDKARDNKPAGFVEADQKVEMIYEDDDYTFDAIWASISATGGTYMYDGTERSISASIKLDTGKLDQIYLDQIGDRVALKDLQYSTDGSSWSSVNPEFTDVGEYTVYVKGMVTVDGVEKQGLRTSAKVVITPRPVRIESATDSKVYDGTPLTNDAITVSDD